MTKRRILAALVLTLAPVAAMAGSGCPHEAIKSASQCPTGQVWDTAQQACVSAVNS